MCVYARVHLPVCAYVEARGQQQDVCFYCFYTFFFEAWSLSNQLPAILASLACQQAPRICLPLIYPQPWGQICTATPGHSMSVGDLKSCTASSFPTGPSPQPFGDFLCANLNMCLKRTCIEDLGLVLDQFDEIRFNGFIVFFKIKFS